MGLWYILSYIYGYSSTRELPRSPPQCFVVAVIVGTLVWFRMGWVVQFHFLKAYEFGLDFTDQDVKIPSVWAKPSDVPLEDGGRHHFLEDAHWGWSPAGFVAGDTIPRFSLSGPDRSRRTVVLGVRARVGINVGATGTVRFDNWWLRKCVCGGALAPAPLAVQLTEDLVWELEPPYMVRVWALLTEVWVLPTEGPTSLFWGRASLGPACLSRGRVGRCTAGWLSWGISGWGSADSWFWECVSLVSWVDSVRAFSRPSNSVILKLSVLIWSWSDSFWAFRTWTISLWFPSLGCKVWLWLLGCVDWFTVVEFELAAAA